MCLFAILAGLAPRIAFAILWLARPNVVAAAFGDVLLWPLLGLVFLPFTTLMYTILWGPGGLTGFDWIWVGIAFVLDLGHYTYSAYGNRDRLPGTSTTG
jgi:hypothetical protein